MVYGTSNYNGAKFVNTEGSLSSAPQTDNAMTKNPNRPKQPSS